jgi:hypothetical protein
VGVYGLRTYIVTEIAPTSEHTRLWRIQIPGYGEPDFQSATQSFLWYFQGRNKRNHKRDGTLYHAVEEEEYNRSQLIWQKSATKNGVEVQEPEIIDIATIWDFYTAVGYDRKKKKYT